MKCNYPILCILCLGGTLIANTSAEDVQTTQTSNPELRLAELQLELPAVSKPVGIYRRAVVVDKLIYLAGHIPIDPDGRIMTGKVGLNVDVQTAQQAARRCGLAMLATLKSELGSLNRVKRLVKTTGMVNCTEDFTEQPTVINGCSQLFVDVFGKDQGEGARSAVGMNSLPKGAIVELEAVFELGD